MEEYIRVHLSTIDAARCAIMPAAEALVMDGGFEEWETALAGSFKRWKHWAGRRDPTVETNADCIDIPFIRSYEEVSNEGPLAALMTRLRNDEVVPKGVSFDLWCVGSDLREEWYVDNHVYSAKDDDFEIHFRRHQE